MRRRIEILRIYNVLDLFESALDSCWIQMVLVIGIYLKLRPRDPIRCYIMLSRKMFCLNSNIAFQSC